MSPWNAPLECPLAIPWWKNGTFGPTPSFYTVILQKKNEISTDFFLYVS